MKRSELKTLIKELMLETDVLEEGMQQGTKDLQDLFLLLYNDYGKDGDWKNISNELASNPKLDARVSKAAQSLYKVLAKII